MAKYWEGSPDEWALIGEVQWLKRQHIEREYGGFYGYRANALKSDQYVITNPVTGREVPKADLIYATKHLSEIYSSGMIREDRWAFLWYR
jgi:hypothetical protein